MKIFRICAAHPEGIVFVVVVSCFQLLFSHFNRRLNYEFD